MRRCLDCHAAYMRGHRPRWGDLTPEERAKQRVRLATRRLQRAGKLGAGPCRSCGSPKAQNHHADYSNPASVIRLCRRCHLDEHGVGA